MMIYIDGSENDRSSLTYASQFCRKFGGRLNVMHLRLAEPTVGSVSLAIAIADQAAHAAKQAFDEICGELAFTEWRDAREGFTDSIKDQGFLHDLTILERISEEEGPQVLALNTALFETGGPVLITPPRTPAPVGESVAVVWSPTVQSARALRSSMPVLAQARKVWILSNSDNSDANPGELIEHLAHRGIAAEAHGFSGARLTARERGRAILKEVVALAADLLVMGAFGENRVSAIFGLGRTTQKVVGASPVPLLIQT